MGIEKLLPKASSFLPGMLGINCGELAVERLQNMGLRKKYEEMSKADLMKIECLKREIAFGHEFIRDASTMALLYFGFGDFALAFYAIATYVEDRLTGFGGI